jgi:hypothetical protein
MRIHYSFQWPTLVCDYFKITATEGNGTGETLQQFPLSPQDYVLADRGHCHAGGIHFATRNQAYVAVRLNQDGSRYRLGPEKTQVQSEQERDAVAA